MIRVVFSWFKRRSQAAAQSDEVEPPRTGNPSRGARFTIEITGPTGERNEDEEVDLVKLLMEVFQAVGRDCMTRGDQLIDTQSGLEFKPGIVSIQPQNDLAAQTCTTIEINHSIKFSQAFFEYQHSEGKTARESVKSGFEDWAKLDLPPLLDALETKLSLCSALEMKFPNMTRRIVLGPVMRWAHNPESPAKPANENEHPPFCACCMFANSAAAFKPFVEDQGVHAIRLFASRNATGEARADCRVNGEDFPEGAAALIAYAKQWSEGGFEARKQYVIIQNAPRVDATN